METVFVTVGASVQTVDDDFELLRQKFEALTVSMKSCKSSSTL